jgi:hypothetical protein
VVVAGTAEGVVVAGTAVGVVAGMAVGEVAGTAGAVAFMDLLPMVAAVMAGVAMH